MNAQIKKRAHMEMIEPKVGMKLYGYCGGCFGRDSYSDKHIEFVGFDYIVCRNDEGQPEFYCEYNNKQIMIPKEWLEKWLDE